MSPPPTVLTPGRCHVRATIALAVAVPMVGASSCRHGSSTDPLQPPAIDPSFGPVDPTPVLTAEAGSGSRLKAVWAIGPGGERVLRHWRDTKLDFNCLFSTAADGKWRCLPLHSVFPGAFHTDPACTVRAVAGFGGMGEKFVKMDASSCPPGVAIHRVGREVPGASRFRLVRHRRLLPSEDSSSCEAAPMTTEFERSLVVYEIGEEIPPENFVAGTLRREPASGPLAPTLLVGEDGSREFWLWSRAAGGGECVVGLAADGELRCLPRSVVGAFGAFSDSACGASAGTARTTSTCQEVELVRGPHKGRCPVLTSIFRGGKRLPTGYALGDSNGCAVASGVYFAMGEEVPPTEFVAARRRRWHASTGPLAIELQEVAGSSVRTEFVDLRFDTRCKAESCNDDLRCAPTTTLEVSHFYFADPTCSQPLADGPANVCPPRVAASVYPTKSCDERAFSWSGSPIKGRST